MKQSSFLEQNPTARRQDDFYRTPRWMTEALLRRLRLHFNWTLFEPAAGDGAIVTPLRARGYRVVTNDLVTRPPFRLDSEGGDARLEHVWRAAQFTFGPLDVSVSNLPFDVAFPIVQRALEFSEQGIAMLLRISFVEPTDDRGPWLALHPPARVIVLPRYSFRGVGSDMATCAWFVWNIGAEIATPGVDVVTKDERDELIARCGKAA